MTDHQEPTDAIDADRSDSIDELSNIFFQVAEAPSERQAAVLNELCPDEDVKRQVRALLAADAGEDTLLDHRFHHQPIECRAGEKIDGYKLTEELGEGGMGVVFKADQFQPVRRTVALKVIKPGVDTREVIARFEAERQALSLMDHPNIAKVLDAGSTEKGRPYFVMEWVQGEPITSYCDANKLSAKARLKLFLPVCRAIQHAHQKGIIHRDIKPSNVLVAKYDGRPVAKVIDFGIAKAIHQPLTKKSLHTGIGQIVGTLEYMSPEQSRFDQLDVDTRSDIYSLGALLYELLTGTPPFGPDRFRSVALDQMLRIIRDEDPPRPSARLAKTKTVSADGSEAADQLVRFRRLVRGELDWIVMKAMDKDRNRRYGTPNGLANDVERFLAGETVTACPPSTLYRFRKFSSRNKVVLATSALVTASLLIGIFTARQQAVRARRAEEATQAVNSFLEEDLLGLAGAESQLSAGLSPDPNLKLTTLLDRALAKVNASFADQPAVKANLQSTLASSFSSIGRYQEAGSLYQQLLKFQRADKGDHHPETLRAMQRLAMNYMNQSRLDLAEPIYDEAFINSEKHLGKGHALSLAIMNDLAMLYQLQKRYDESASVYDECLETRKRLFGPRHPDTLITISNLATLWETLGRYAEAESLHAEVLDTRRDQLTEKHPLIADALQRLGRCHLNRGRHHNDPADFARALPLLQEGLIINQQDSARRGIDHPTTRDIASSLAQVQLELGNYDEAIAVLEDLLQRMGDAPSTEQAFTLKNKSILGWAYLQQGRLEEAENLFRELLDCELLSDPTKAWTLQVRSNLAIALYRLAKLEESIAMDEQTLATANQVLGPDHGETLSAAIRLGLSYLETEQIEEGRRLLENSFLQCKPQPIAPTIAAYLSDSYANENDYDNAIDWKLQQQQTAKDCLSTESPELAQVLAECESRIADLKVLLAEGL